MFEKVNPAHPDKIADRIAGAVVDLAYKVDDDPKIAVEVLIGHGVCHVIVETTVMLDQYDIAQSIMRIAGPVRPDIQIVPQDKHLTQNQRDGVRCGDNGIFKGTVVTAEQEVLSKTVRDLYEHFPYDGKFILDGARMIVCQSNIDTEAWRDKCKEKSNVVVNPLGDWTGGPDVDTGATNRKLGSDMGDSVTGGGLHGKDLSKADVSVNIYAWIKAQKTGQNVELCCAIGDETIDGRPYSEIVEVVRDYINKIGGFEKFAEWGLI